jgi:hypothetical protein
MLVSPDRAQVAVNAVSPIGGPFTLTTQAGTKLSDTDLKGKPFLVVFGFTRCPEVCPTTLWEMTQAFKALGSDAAIPGGALKLMVVPKEDDRATVFIVNGSGKDNVVALDPHGPKAPDAIVKDDTWFYRADNIHGTLLLDDLGDRLIEIAASLGIVLILTGIWGTRIMQAWNTFPARSSTTCRCPTDARLDEPWRIEGSAVDARTNADAGVGLRRQRGRPADGYHGRSRFRRRLCPRQWLYRAVPHKRAAGRGRGLHDLGRFHGRRHP